MRLLCLEAVNIFSIGHIEIDLTKRGVLLVTGYSEDEGSANGAGKSSVANKAILWGLYGRTASGSRADSVINCHNPKSTASISIEFSVGDTSKYKIVRSRNPNKLRLLSIDGTDLSSRNEVETQEKINALLGKDFDTFIQTDFFGQGREASYVALKPADQKEVLESILPIEKLNDWAARAKAEMESYEVQLAKTSNKIEKIKSALLVHEENEASMLQKMNAFELTRSAKLKQLDTSLQMAHMKKAENEEEINKLKGLIVEMDYDVNGFHKSYQNLRSQHDTVSKSYITAMDLKNSWHNKCVLLKSQIVDTICDKCGQELCPDAMVLAIERNKQIEQDLIKATENYEKASDAKEYYKAEKDRIEKEIEDLKKDQDRFEENNKNNRSIEGRINALIISANTWQPETIMAERNRVRDENNPYTASYEEYAEQEQRHKVELKRLETYLIAQGEMLSNYTFWFKAYSKDLKIHLLESVCPFLEARTKAHLEMLGNPQIHAKFSTCKVLKSGMVKEDFNVTVWSDTGGAQYDLLSGGEQVITNFAVGLALSDLAESQTKGRSNILILDEPFTNLDPRNCENVTSYLNSMDKETIMVISNEESLQGLIPNRLHVIKKNGISNLEV